MCARRLGAALALGVMFVAAPAAGWAGGSTHKVDLTIIDRTVSWTFGVANIRTPVFAIEAEDFDNNGVAPAATSVMPYRGGALAGQSASNNKDYTRGNEGASPIYRFYNATTGAHFYTISAAERDFVIQVHTDFRYEGPMYHAWTTQ